MMTSGRASPDAPPRVAFSTLGCKLNLYETDSLATTFADNGYKIVPFGEAADVYVINSCTVTNRADRKSRNLLYRSRRRGDDGREGLPLVVVTGCFADSHRDDIEADGHTLVVPNADKHAIFDLVEAHARGEVFEPSGSVFSFTAPSRVFHTRTMIKVQDGCDNFCSFCIIPTVRGRAVSRPAVDVVTEAQTAIRGGAHELVLTGVNMSRYNDHGVRFAELVRKLLEMDGDYRIRISSLEPDGIDERFIELFAHPKMSRHLHLCLQSASERILLAMRRQYTFDEYVGIAAGLRKIDPLFNLTTDVIVGFPGETDGEFEETVQAIDALGFGHVHTFPYSERSGTRAARMPNRIPERIRTERAATVRLHAEAARARYRTSLIGIRQRLLVERTEPSTFDRTSTLVGFGEHYAPLRVPAPSGAENWHNRFVQVSVVRLDDGADPTLSGVAVERSTA